MLILNPKDYSKIDDPDELASMMTDEEYLFSCEYLRTFSIDKALKKVAQYEPNLNDRGQKIIDRPIVQRYIYLRRGILKENYLSKEDIQLSILNNVNLASKAGEYNAVMKGLELLAKTVGIMPQEIAPPLEAKGRVVYNIDGKAIDVFYNKFSSEF